MKYWNYLDCLWIWWVAGDGGDGGGDSGFWDTFPMINYAFLYSNNQSMFNLSRFWAIHDQCQSKKNYSIIKFQG